MNITNASDVPIEQLYSHPVVKELLSKLENIDLEKDVKIPYVMQNKILMSPGVWNGYFYSSEAIQNAFLTTPWDDKEVRSLFLDHEDLKSHEWIGEVGNPHMVGDDLVGDLIFVDKPTAMKLAYGAKMGISPKVSGGEEEGRMIQFKYDNFSVVINPAVKTAYINNAQKDSEKGPYGDVKYADPGFQKDKQKRYPIDTEEHVRAAWSYINVPKNREFYTKEQLDKMEKSIKSAAKKFGISITNQEVNKMAEEEQPKPEETPEVKPTEDKAAEETPEAPEEKKEDAPEETTEVENAESIVDVFSELKITNAGVGDVAKKAKEIIKKNPDMKWSDAIKEAAKGMAEPEAPKVEKKEEVKKMSDEEILKHAVEIINAKKILSEEEEAPKEEAKEEPAVEEPKVEEPVAVEEPKVEEPKAEVTNEMSQKMESQMKTIMELSERLEAAEKKLNEPDKASIKSEELSQATTQDPDSAFMNALMAI